MPEFLRATVFILALAGTLSTCVQAQVKELSDKVNQENFLKVREGMTPKQVEALLGPPTTITTVDEKLIHLWQNSRTVAKVEFEHGQVTLKQAVGLPTGNGESPKDRTTSILTMERPTVPGTETEVTNFAGGLGYSRQENGTVIEINFKDGKVISTIEKVFAPQNGMFTVTLPAGHRNSQRTQALVIKKQRVGVEQSLSMTEEGTTYVGGAIGIPAVVLRDLPANERFDVLSEALVRTMNGKIRGEKDIEQDAIPGKEYQIELQSSEARLQLYTVAGFAVYLVVEGKNQAVITQSRAEDFFRSLKFTDKAKAVFREVKR